MENYRRDSRASKNMRGLHIFYNIFGFIFGGAFNIALMLFIVYLIYTYTLSAFAFGKDFGSQMDEEKPSREVEVTIEENSTTSQVAAILKEKGLVQSALMFQLECLLNRDGENFPGGDFVLNANMKNRELISALRNVIVYGSDVTVTIAEGYTVKDIAQLLESKELVSAEDFIEACNTGDFRYDFLEEAPQRENRLEGYLFPDTYKFAENSTPEQIIHKLLTRFDEIYSPEYRKQAEDMGLTTDQVVTIASIIEKEIRVASERPKAAEVIYNRLEDGMKLQMCSTVLYALDKRKDRLLDEDLAVESPYNTYLHSGLPVGPIANPGEACIKAALNPGQGNLLYFVVKDEDTGEHVFTHDEAAFFKAKADYNQKY